mmetsp:Transcript_17667/g.35524  ORF Transcript_17667/g.35524 Transcript_17667/m.35524 type:complete len:470 (+) Transcript_17667:74-1483(+)
MICVRIALVAAMSAGMVSGFVGTAPGFLQPSKFSAPMRASSGRAAAVSGLRMVDEGKKIVVTGLGVMSGVGDSLDSFWDNLIAGKGSIDRVTRFDASAYTCQIASQVGDFTPGDYFNSAKTAKSQDRFTHLAVAAARMAVEDSGLKLDNVDKSRFGVLVGSAFGGMQTYEDQTIKVNKLGPKKCSPFTIPALLGNTASGVIGIELGAQGPNFGVTSACAVGSHSIGEALNTLRRGDADVMLAGGSEAAITPLSFAGFCAMKAMNTKSNDDPSKGSRPFDLHRAGFVMGEGAGVVLLETLEHAEKRGAKIYCELAGYGATCDAHHITTPAPGGAGLAACIERAIQSSGMDKSEIGYVNAHGTSTPYNDKFETMALKSVFGQEGAKNLKISSTKGSTGHTLGAAGGVEAVITAKMLQTGMVPPTIGFEEADPELDLDYCFSKAQHCPDIKAAISENLGFGGHNAAIVMRKV